MSTYPGTRCYFIDSHSELVLLGGEKNMCNCDAGYLKCGFSFIEDNKGQNPQK